MIVALLIFSGCSQSLYMQGRTAAEKGDYDSAVEKYYAELKINPQNLDAWRSLGIAFYNKNDWIKAEDAFKQANAIEPDAQAHLYMGLIFEKNKQYDKAIAAYATAANLKASSKTKKLIHAHLDRLLKEKFQRETKYVIQNETQINTDTIPPNTIAVVNFDGSQLDTDMAPIALGLAEFTSVDLSKVSGLKVVDRLKIDLIQNELNLTKSQYADPANAPRVGKLIGSRRIITGTVLGAGGNLVRLDGAIVNVQENSSDLTGPTEGNIRQFFKIQKDFVFKLIDSLGISLTKEERDAIAEVPTESFIAFMAYCRGLNYQLLGMPQAARESFQQALQEDNGFAAAESQAERLAALYTGGGTATPSSVENFEISLIEDMVFSEFEEGLDQTMRNHLINSGFMHDHWNFDRFGFSPIRPPITDITERVIVIVRGVTDVQ
jgi:tetratricopeptide (TPR) repeat protein